jgi:hypothetical protein
MTNEKTITLEVELRGIQDRAYSIFTKDLYPVAGAMGYLIPRFVIHLFNIFFY